MVPSVRRDEVLDGNAGIALRRRDGGVAEHELHAPHIGTVLESVRRESEAQNGRFNAPSRIGRVSALLEGCLGLFSITRRPRLQIEVQSEMGSSLPPLGGTRKRNGRRVLCATSFMRCQFLTTCLIRSQ